VTVVLYAVAILLFGLRRRSRVAVSWLMAVAAFDERCHVVYLARKFFVCPCRGRNGGSTGTKPRRGMRRWRVETVAATGRCVLMLL
jgi:hypothetical protein